MGEETFVRSTLGTQISSSRTSAPSYGFGSASREQASKLFVSSEHSKLAGGKNASPGPAVYEQPSTLGPQLASPFDSPPRWVFGTSSRFDKAKGTAAPSPDTYEQRSSLGAQINSSLPNQPMPSFGSSTRESVRKVYVSEKHSNSAFGGMTSNGPASYGLKGSIGQQQLSPNRSSESWAFGSSQRFYDPELERTKKLPAPDAYTVGSGLGPQNVSTKRTAPLPGFGSCTRDNTDKIYMSPEHEKTKSYGKASPGPNVYDSMPGLGPQLLSDRRKAPTYAFGSCDRWYTRNLARRHGQTPAPGAYNV